MLSFNSYDVSRKAANSEAVALITDGEALILANSCHWSGPLSIWGTDRGVDLPSGV